MRGVKASSPSQHLRSIHPDIVAKRCAMRKDDVKRMKHAVSASMPRTDGAAFRRASAMPPPRAARRRLFVTESAMPMHVDDACNDASVAKDMRGKDAMRAQMHLTRDTAH